MTLLRYVIRILLLKIIVLFSIMLITMIGMPLGFGESPILIQTDKNLALSKVYPINDNIEENIFVSKTNIYYKSRFISLPH